MKITRADSRQEEFFTSNGKLYINFEQVEKQDDVGNVFWEMKTLEVSDKREAYDAIKEYKLAITELPNGLRFYTDEKSLLDLMIADRQAELLGATNEDSTEWKTVEGIKAVTIKDIRDAIALRLNNKAKIVGVL